jgi:hypothetical protein
MLVLIDPRNFHFKETQLLGRNNKTVFFVRQPNKKTITSTNNKEKPTGSMHVNPKAIKIDIHILGGSNRLLQELFCERCWIKLLSKKT